MRVILLILMSFMMACHAVNDCYGQAVGKEGNRVVGLVVRADGTAFSAGEAAVGVFRREDKLKDYTNEDGIFCIAIPKEVTAFHLVYRAAGHWGILSPEIASIKDPIKVNKVSLRKKDPNDISQLQTIDSLLQTELAIYRGTSSTVLRKAMRDELIKFSDSIEIPPPDPDPTRTAFPQEREIRINARISIDTIVIQMK